MRGVVQDLPYATALLGRHPIAVHARTLLPSARLGAHHRPGPHWLGHPALAHGARPTRLTTYSAFRPRAGSAMVPRRG